LEPSTLDDPALVACIADWYGDAAQQAALNAAVGALYDRYGRLVYSVALHVVGEAETAEEITQDVFVRACEGARGYRPDVARVSSWLASIARHRAIDELRRRAVRPESARADWPDDLGQERALGLPLANGPEEMVETRLAQRRLRQRVAGLPPDQRQAVWLAFFLGLSQSEIAEHLQQPLGTVKSRIRLAMQKLRGALDGSEIHDDL
jgi:RNA polymerase sigma-70 factor (ECF subfamily)